MRYPQSYCDAAKGFTGYWRAYGGWRALLSSPYLHLSIVLGVILWPTWSCAGWWSDPLSILANILGFTLAGFTIFITFGDEKFREILVGPSDDGAVSPLISAGSKFVHFIVVQVVAIMLALIARSRPLSWISPDFYEKIVDKAPLVAALRFIFGNIYWFFCYSVFIYAVVLTIATVMHIFLLVGWYDKIKSEEIKEKN